MMLFLVVGLFFVDHFKMVPQNQKKVDEILHKTPYKVSFVDERVVVPVRGGESSATLAHKILHHFSRAQGPERQRMPRRRWGVVIASPLSVPL